MIGLTPRAATVLRQIILTRPLSELVEPDGSAVYPGVDEALAAIHAALQPAPEPEGGLAE